MSAETGQSRVEANPGLEQLKQRMRDTWMAGDFGQIARHTAKGAEEFVARLPISPGMRVLDVACVTGNLAIPAARRGRTLSTPRQRFRIRDFSVR